MGLDQSVYKMSRETFDFISEWKAGDQQGPFPDVEMEQVWSGRKENHIQAYIEGEVGDVDNCDYLPLSRQDVQRLVDRLIRVEADHEQAGVLLPTQEGFFFGTTDYDEWYFEDIKAELKAFTEILDSWDDNEVYAYWAWW